MSKHRSLVKHKNSCATHSYAKYSYFCIKMLNKPKCCTVCLFSLVYSTLTKSKLSKYVKIIKKLQIFMHIKRVGYYAWKHLKTCTLIEGDWWITVHEIIYWRVWTVNTISLNDNMVNCTNFEYKSGG